MKGVTAGERLFFLIRDEVVHSIGERNARWTQAKEFLDGFDENQNFTKYVKGAIAVRSTRQLTRFWNSMRDSVGDESLSIKIISRFIRGEIFPSIESELCLKLARRVDEASRASDRTVKPGLRRAVLGDSRFSRCFLCGMRLDGMEPHDSKTYPTLEHLWPTSVGGDTIEENLLPACHYCQSTTKDALSWEWFNVHNVVLSIDPSQESLTAVDKRTRYARHYFEAITSAETEGGSLKQAFQRLGPMVSPPSHVRTDAPVTFFDLRTF